MQKYRTMANAPESQFPRIKRELSVKLRKLTQDGLHRFGKLHTLRLWPQYGKE